MNAPIPYTIGPRGTVRDALSTPGHDDRANEDAYGWHGHVAWVIDGATGLGDTHLTEGPSDAAWLAAATNDALHSRIDTGEHDPVRLMQLAAEDVAARFARERLRAPEHRYEIPTCALLIARIGKDAIDVAELGDARLYVHQGDGSLSDVGGLAAGRDLERENAARLIRPETSVRTPEVLAHLRAIRDIANTEGGYWVFAPDPAPAARARRHRVPLAMGAATALLLTDGLDALASDYGRYNAEGFVRAASTKRLAPLMDELRTIERVEDADRRRFPRFKQSDDATGIVVEIAAAE